MQKIFGQPLAKKILRRIEEDTHAQGIQPGLAVLLVGTDAPSHLYVNLKERQAKSVGIAFEKQLFPENVSASELLFAIHALNDREDIHGIVLQLPLPRQLDPDRFVDAILPEKDTDGFHPATLQNFLGGDERSLPVFPRAVRELIVSAADEEELTGKRGLVLAKSTLLGDVMRAVLEHLGLETHVAVLESVRELPLPFLTQADVIVTALGEPHLLKGEMFKEGAIVIDGGIVSTKSGVQGDVDPVGLAEKKGFYTPVPGGVGPVTVALLLARVTEAAAREAAYRIT